MQVHGDYELALRLFLSFLIGAAIGVEREYRSKAAGLRTMIVICLGSTIFTELSFSFGSNSPDRVAANIITGIGFLGAGVIFKDGLSITGITTATTIWICAALGMAVGVGEYFIALVGSVVVLVVLILFERLQEIVERLHQARTYKITFRGHEHFDLTLDKELVKIGLRYYKKKDMKDELHTFLIYEVLGKEKKLNDFNTYLKENEKVKAYEY
jgi:putative Mg2+ transporter-C (MgtC) family protein